MNGWNPKKKSTFTLESKITFSLIITDQNFSEKYVFSIQKVDIKLL